MKNVTWLRNNIVLNLNQSRFDGGNPELTALLVKNATREDSGTYVCELENQIGPGTSERGVVVNVQCEYCVFSTHTHSLASRLLSLQTERVTG